MKQCRFVGYVVSYSEIDALSKADKNTEKIFG